MSAKFEIFKTKDKFNFRLRASNGRIILGSEVYERKLAAEHGIHSVRSNAVRSKCYEKKVSKNGKHYFNLKAKNGQVIGVSQMYSSEEAMITGIKSVTSNAPIASIVDLTIEGENDIRSSNTIRIGDQVFIAPFAQLNQVSFQKGVVKINRNEAANFLRGTGALEHVLLDFKSFNFVQSKFSSNKLIEGLEEMINLIKRNPEKVLQILHSTDVRGGYTKEIQHIYEELDLKKIKHFESSITSALLFLSSISAFECACLQGGPDDPVFPENPPNSGEAPPEKEDPDKEEKDPSG